VRKGDDLTTFIVPKVMKNPEALTYRIPKGRLSPVAGEKMLCTLRALLFVVGCVTTSYVMYAWSPSDEDGDGSRNVSPFAVSLHSCVFDNAVIYTILQSSKVVDTNRVARYFLWTYLILDTHPPPPDCTLCRAPLSICNKYFISRNSLRWWAVNLLP
jgi:hypothetical protein